MHDNSSRPVSFDLRLTRIRRGLLGVSGTITVNDDLIIPYVRNVNVSFLQADPHTFAYRHRQTFTSAGITSKGISNSHRSAYRRDPCALSPTMSTDDFLWNYCRIRPICPFLRPAICVRCSSIGCTRFATCRSIRVSTLRFCSPATTGSRWKSLIGPTGLRGRNMRLFYWSRYGRHHTGLGVKGNQSICNILKKNHLSVYQV